MEKQTQTKLEQFLNAHLADSKTAKQKLETISNEFIVSNNLSKDASIPYKELIPLFSAKKLIEVRKKITKLSDSEFIVPSPRQRGKYSQIFDSKNVYNGTTWNETGIASGLISWFTGVSIPAIKINVNTLSTDGVLTIWDGESKFQIIWYFINGAPDMFRVLKDDGTWIDEVYNFMKHPDRFRTDKNSHLVEMLKQMFNEAKSTSKTYVSLEWMLNLGFDVLVESLLNLEPVCIFQNLPEMVEGEAYHREGKIGARQSDVQLTNSQMIEAWYEVVRFDETQRPTNRFKQALKHSIFNDKDFPLFRDIFQDIHSGENYQGYDEYIYDFILSNLFDIEGKKVSFGISDDLDMTTLSGIARPYDKGTRIVSDKMKLYKEFMVSEHISDSEKERVKNKLIQIFKMIETVFGYMPPKDQAKYTGVGRGLNDDRTVSLFKPTTPSDKRKGFFSIKDSQTQELREFLLNHGIDRPKNLGYIDKFILKEHLLVYLICKAISYVLRHPDVKENQLSEILHEMILITKEKWIEYASEYQLPKDKRNWYTPEEIFETINSISSYNGNDPSFGLLYAINGGNLEKVAWVWLKFYTDVVEARLDNLYLTATSTTKQMRNFKSWLSREKGVIPEQFFVYDTINDNILNLDKFDIGHPEAEAYGNILFHKEFLLEERLHNRQKFQTDSKDLVSYYRCMMANHNDILAKRNDVLTTSMNRKEAVRLYQEADQALDNLKLLLEYIGVAYDESASYKNKTVKEEEYIK